jgi:ABC-2 type transport system ATP-binding protein
MSHILDDQLRKTYRISERDPGVMGALRRHYASTGS